ncbi:Hypothetical protein SMAX5B_006713 [Scophthalmus maximus]|uniref:Uncharacterized protein n=1 Tax=Scophthalmus maximus TaxID=52904 RepID=A0A2U9C8I0_SCOMX|nr:Hypothetical protein SMAX5B_006713 [Scophthalmus maximus]
MPFTNQGVTSLRFVSYQQLVQTVHSKEVAMRFTAARHAHLLSPGSHETLLSIEKGRHSDQDYSQRCVNYKLF